MTGFVLTLGIGLVVGGVCGLLLASIVIWMIESAGRGMDDLEDR